MDRLLPQLPIFAGLTEAALKLLSSEAHPLVFEAATVILKEGETGNKMFVIDSGQVRITKRCAQTRDVELAVLGPGDCFGEGCILTTLPRAASVWAISRTTAFQISSMAFYHLHHTMPDQHGILVLNLARDLSRRLRRLDEIYAACH